LTKKTIK